MSPDEYTLIRDMLLDQNEHLRRLVERFDSNLSTQNRIVRQVANAQAQAGVLNTRVTSVDRSLREVVDRLDDVDDRLEQLPIERLGRWDNAAAVLEPDRVKGWDDASRNSRRFQWVITRSWKAFLVVGTSAGGTFAVLLELLRG